MTKTVFVELLLLATRVTGILLFFKKKKTLSNEAYVERAGRLGTKCYLQ